jgi:hypothetical protein
MSADLKCNTTLRRTSLVILDDCLVMLEHELTRDRVRKVMFDRVESVLIWAKVPWLRIVLLFVLLGLPALGILLIHEPVSTAIALVLLAFVVGMNAGYAYCGHTTIRIVRAGQTYEISGIFRRGPLTRFRARLLGGIRRVQQNLAVDPSVETAGSKPGAAMAGAGASASGGLDAG